MKKYVISLESALDRREHIMQEFKKQNIEFEFFDAVMPEQAVMQVNQILPNVKMDRISLGELACCISHLSIWKHAIEKNISHIAIFEDDIFLSNAAHNFLAQSDWIKQDWDIIKLETFHEKVFIDKLSTDILDRHSSRLKSSHFGAAGYIITNQAMHKILENLKLLKELPPIDHILFSDHETIFKSLHIQQISPALCIQEKILYEKVKLSNALDSYRNQWHPPKKKLHTSQKIFRELNRLLRKIKFLLFAQIIQFK